MAPLDIDTALGWRGRTVVDRDGDRIGKLDELYLDESERPAWGAVTTGLFGRRQSFVPLADLRPSGDDLQVPYGKDRVKDAPNVDPDEQLSGEEEDALHRHYGLDPGPPPADARDDARAHAGGDGDERDARPARSGGDDDGAAAQRAAAGEGDAPAVREEDEPRAADEADARPVRPADDEGAEMIRSEEEVDVGTRRRVRGKARLKKYVVTEHVQKVVPVQREEVRVEFEPSDEEEDRRPG